MHKEKEKLQRKRPQWAKEGKFRYLNRKLDAIRDEVRAIKRLMDTRLRVLTNTLAPFMQIEPDYITQIVCADEADGLLLDYLLSAGDLGITPGEAVQEETLRRFRFKPYQITRRLQRMNKLLQAELGKSVAEKYHRRWVITGFVSRAWNGSKEEVEAELAEDSPGNPASD